MFTEINIIAFTQGLLLNGIYQPNFFYTIIILESINFTHQTNFGHIIKKHEI
jgi:hypothetical protein